MKRIVDIDYVIQEGDWIRTNYDLTLSHYASKTIMGLVGKKIRDCGDITVFERLFPNGPPTNEQQLPNA